MTTTRDGLAVEARRLSKVFGDATGAVRALDDVSVGIRNNEFFTLLGPSGCGKTTLLRLIAGFEHPSSGEILLGGADISHEPPYRRPVNTVFQSYALFPHLTVEGNVAFGLEMLGRGRDEVAETVDEMLALVKMESLRNRRVAQISGGQQQRVALARALAPRPRVLLLDEPLSALDLKLRKEMQVELKRLQHQTGITFVFVTHDQEEALTMSDRVAVMRDGRILQVGTPREIYERPANRFVARFIGDTNILDGVCEPDPRGVGRVRLACGLVAASPDPGRSGPVSVLVRPEHLAIDHTTDDAPAGVIERAVYFGTDTLYHVLLGDAHRVVVRRQNRRGDADRLVEGARVGLRLDGDAIQLLDD